jgi:ATP-dependent DNA helicase RecQ
VLVGKETDKVFQFSHQRLSVFGVGKELKSSEWQSLFRQLLAKGILRADLEAYGALKFTAASALVMKGETKVLLRKMRLKTPAAKKGAAKFGSAGRTARSVAGGSTYSMSSDAEHLLAKMKELRYQLAQKLRVPPYVIFHDKTLMEMAQKRPIDSDELGAIHGVGEHKLRKFGQAFLQLIEEN